jgi:hypothetical protein
MEELHKRAESRKSEVSLGYVCHSAGEAANGGFWVIVGQSEDAGNSSSGIGEKLKEAVCG